MAKKKEVPEEIQNLLVQVCQFFAEEDSSTRDRQIRTWKRLKLLWDGLANTFWSETAHDWRIYDQQYADDSTNDSAYYDKRPNIFKAYSESIIAALSVTVPPIKCYPDNADDPLDLTTAKGGDKIAELVYRHNDAVLLWIKALYVFVTEGLICCYNYTDYDEKYGTYEEDEYEDQEQEVDQKICDVCGTQLVNQQVMNQVQDEFDPGQNEIDQHDLLNQGVNFCPVCLTQVINPQIKREKLIVERLIGKTTKPKSRQCLEVYGGLFVKVANYAQKQADTPYLRFSYETNLVNVLEQFPDLRKNIDKKGKLKSSGNDSSNYERWGRVSNQYRGTEPQDTPTCSNTWLRPSAYNILQDDEVEKLRKLYPFGVKVVQVNDFFAEACAEKLDDHWTLSENPLSDYLHHEPLGKVLEPIQEISNDLISLILQTIEHGIEQTFVDPEVVNFDAYRQQEVSPGSLIPAKPKSGRTLGESFYSVKTANLSGEVLPFANKVQELGQLVSGALPSLFGGENSAGSKTASEYSMSRAQALQRLQTTWKMLSIWWKQIFGKVIPAYIQSVIDDERYVEKSKDGGFINILIKKSELAGKLGSVELEAAEQMPVTWLQQKDVILNLMNLNNPLILEALSAPENIDILKNVIGLNSFVIPGNDDRTKQYEEIQQLIISEPIMLPGQPMDDGMGNIMPAEEQELPSIEVEQFVDNHFIQSEICRRWLVSDAGRICKVENPLGYRNVMLHMMGHINFLQMQQMQQQESNNSADSKGAEKQGEQV